MAASNLTTISCDRSKPTHGHQQQHHHHQLHHHHNSHHHHHNQSLRRREREKLLTSLWSHAWTKRQSPEWKPRRASVATCQRSRHNSASYQIPGNSNQPQQPTSVEYSNLLCGPWESNSSHQMATMYQQLTDTTSRPECHDQFARKQVASRQVESPPSSSSLQEEKKTIRLSQATAAAPTAQQSVTPATAAADVSANTAVRSDGQPPLIKSVETGSDAETGPRESTLSTSDGSSCSSSGSTVISAAAATTTTTGEPTGRKRRAQLSGLSLDPYPPPPRPPPPAAFGLAGEIVAKEEKEEGSCNKIDNKHNISEKQLRAKIEPKNPTCCSTTIHSTSTSNSTSTITTASLGGGSGDLEATTGAGHCSQPTNVPSDGAGDQPPNPMASNRELQMQDKQRKSLIYSMALKKMGGSNGSSGKMACRMIGRRRYSSQLAAAETGMGGCCSASTTCESVHHHDHQQQQQPNGSSTSSSCSNCSCSSTTGLTGSGGSKKTVSDNSSSRPQPVIDRYQAATTTSKLVSSPNTTTPMTCCRRSSDQPDNNKTRKEGTDLVVKPARVRRSGASSSRMLVESTVPLRPWGRGTSDADSAHEKAEAEESRGEGGGQQVQQGCSAGGLLGGSGSSSSRLALEQGELINKRGEDHEKMALFCQQQTMLANNNNNNNERRLSSFGGNSSSSNTTNSCNLDEGANLSEVDDSESEGEGKLLVGDIDSGDNKLIRGPTNMIMLAKPSSNDTNVNESDFKNQAITSGGCCCVHNEDANQLVGYASPPARLDDDGDGDDHDCCDNLDLESLIIESWLDDHPSFVQDYFMRKASRQLIDNWLLMHAKVSNTNLLSSQLDLAGLTAPNGSSQSPQAAHHTVSLQQNLQQHPGSMRVSSSIGGFGRSTRSSSGQSGHATPVRKISATDFESRTGSGFLRPMVSTTPDGRPTFLSQPAPSSPPPPLSSNNDEDLIETRHNNSHAQLQTAGSRGSMRARSGSKGSEQHQQHPLSLNETSESSCLSVEDNKDDEKKAENATATTGRDADDQQDQEDPDDDDREVKLIFELVKNICNDLDIKTLLHKILKNIAVLINADKSSLFLVCGQPGDPNRRLVSQLFNVDQDSELAASGGDAGADSTAPEGNHMDDCITIPWGTGLVGYVAESGQSVNIENCYDDPRFTDTIDQRTGYVTRHMLCAPILDKRNDIVGVAQVINKRDGNPFSKSDELKFKRYLQFCGIGLRNAQSYENCQLENRRNQVLLDLARMVFEEQSTIEQVVYRIMLHTQSLLECQRCQVLLIDDGSDDLEQLLQLPNSSSLYHQDSQHNHLPLSSSMSLKTISNSSSAPPGNENDGTHSAQPPPPPPPKPTWRPHCNASANVAVRATSEASIHHDDGDGAGDNNNNSNNNSDRHGGADDDDGDDDDDDDDASGRNSIRLEGGAVTSASAAASHQPQPKLFSLVFDLECDGNDLVMHSNKEGNPKAGSSICDETTMATTKLPLDQRFPINIGITGYVAMTGETLNIEDAHRNERFDPSVDMNSNFRHKSILCMPIRNGQRQIIGVSQLINKKNGRPFNKNDEDLFEAFAIFCGLGIHNTLMYEKVLKIMAKQRVTFEVLSYHATAPLEEAKKLNSEIIPSCYALNLTSLKFNDFSLDEQFMLKSCLRFFLDLDLIRRFQIDQLVFCNWILSVQKNYRKVTYHPIVGGNGLKASPVRYHNWRHAFNVSQMMFAILINTQICQALGELETLALLIACLCHDLDHRGTNNSFQIKSASPLAELYSTSTMEHHHFDQCVMILNSQGNQILANLTPDEYSRVIVLLEEAILATDLANYFQKREPFFRLVNGNQFNWSHNPEHRSLLRCMLMTACDVAAITKPWPVQKVVADLVMSEFYQQGDIEKQELNIEPIDMMNRDKRSKLPEMQIGFIDSICAPIYAAFARLFPRELGPLLDGCLTNRDIWTEMSKSNQLEDADLPLANYLTKDHQLRNHTARTKLHQPNGS